VTRESEWQLTLPLALAYAAFFLVPLGLLVAVSAFGDERITTLDGAQWRKFLGDPLPNGDRVVSGAIVTAIATVAIKRGYHVRFV